MQVLFLLCGTILVATPSAGILSRVRALLTIGSKNAANKSVVISYNGNTQARLAAKNTSTYGIQTQGIKSVTEGNTSEGFVKHGLVLPTYVLCLTASQCSDGSQAQWLASNGKSNQLWIYAKYY